MSNRRYRKSAYKTPIIYVDGWPLCRHCSRKTPSKNRTFCSKVCVHEWKLRTSVTYVREHLFARDKGVCHDCRADTELLRRRLWAMPEADRHVEMERLGIPKHRKTFWDAHHVLPVAMGGGESGLENYFTLCIPCHAGHTNVQRKKK